MPLHSYCNFLWNYIQGVERKGALCMTAGLSLCSSSSFGSSSISTENAIFAKTALEQVQFLHLHMFYLK